MRNRVKCVFQRELILGSFLERMTYRAQPCPILPSEALEPGGGGGGLEEAEPAQLFGWEGP